MILRKTYKPKRGRARKCTFFESNRKYFKKNKIKTYNNFIGLPSVINLVKRPKHKFKHWGSDDYFSYY